MVCSVRSAESREPPGSHQRPPRNVPVLVLYNLDRAWTASEGESIRSEARLLMDGLVGQGHRVEAAEVGGLPFPDLTGAYPPDEWVVFNWCESIPGVPYSEARVAEELESRGYAFTGASSAALRLAGDKRRVKKLLFRDKVPTPAWQVCRMVAEAAAWDSFPAIVKPAFEHSSIGVDREAVVLTRQDLACRMAHVFETMRQPVLVEEFIDGREFHVPVWGNARIEVLPAVEMDFSYFSDIRDWLCTYDAKFHPESVHFQKTGSILPARLTADERARLEEVCQAAYRSQWCRDYARLDLRLRGGEFYVLDVNANADISPEASIACAAAEAGWSFGAMASRMVRMAAERLPAGEALQAAQRPVARAARRRKAAGEKPAARTSRTITPVALAEK